MIRELENMLRGRKKTIDESIVVEEALSLISGLNGTIITFDYNLISKDYFERSKVDSKTALDLIEERFLSAEFDYTDVRRQVFEKGATEKHYLEFESGRMFKILDGKMVRAGSQRKAILQYLK